MCNFLSFLVDKQGKLYFGDLFSHAGIETGHNLKPGEYREVEWTEESSKYLTVRVEDKENENFYKALILGLYKTRKDLLKGKIMGKTDLAIFTYKDGKLHSFNAEPAIVYCNGSKEWYYKDGKLHSFNDRPAIDDNGNKYWCKDGKIHRDNDEPAIIWSNGDRCWYKNGERHKFYKYL